MGTSSADKGNCSLLIGTNEGQTRQMAFDLQEAGYAAVVALSAAAGLAKASESSPALIVVDRLLGTESGLGLCQTLRSQGIKAPMVLLMAKDSLEDRVACLECG